MQRDISSTLFLLPPDAKVLPVSDLSPRVQAKIGPVDARQLVVTRPGFRVTAKLIAEPLAALLGEFREPRLLTDGVLRFSLVHDQDPFAMLDLAFDALATLVAERILVPSNSAEAQTQEPSFGAGQAFAGFEIESLVRSLEDTELYRVRNSNGEPAALKIARDERQAAMLANETQMLERLAGADCPRLLASGVERGRAHVVMEWCDGVSVAAAAQQARAARDWRRLHRLVSALLDAYGRLHAKNILHCDIHPGNCLATDDGRIIILDFGRARLVSGARTADPARASILRFHDLQRAGIPHFYDPQMASALLAGSLPPRSTAAAEQYSVAVLAYLLLTGLHPIDASAEQNTLLRQIAEREPLPFAARGVAAWPGVEAVLGRALAKDPRERFPDVACFAGAFRAAGRKSRASMRWPVHLRQVLDAALERVRTLSPAADPPLRFAWFGLRAALAFEDVELLEAADLLTDRVRAGDGMNGVAAPSWAAEVLAAKVARARSDREKERRAIAGFLAAVDTQRPESFETLLAAAEMLEGAALRKGDVTELAAWAENRLKSSWDAIESDASPQEALLAHAALALGQTGTIHIPGGVPAQLEKLLVAGEGSVWLWALAHYAFADPRFAQQALAALQPSEPLERGIALLWLHRLTGDLCWVADARRHVLTIDRRPTRDIDTALLMIELKSPEQAAWPSFLMSRRRGHAQWPRRASP